MQLNRAEYAIFVFYKEARDAMLRCGRDVIDLLRRTKEAIERGDSSREVAAYADRLVVAERKQADADRAFDAARCLLFSAGIKPGEIDALIKNGTEPTARAVAVS